jgi:predicted HTH transcriptional regulator
LNCHRCQESIPAGEECRYLSQVLCEDCYIEAVDQAKTCDVAAVHAAKRHRAALGQQGTEGLTELQRRICDFVRERGKTTRAEIAREFGLADRDVERQFAVLRHCEVLKGAKEGDQIFIVPFR